MKNSVKNLIEITENKSKKYDVDEIVGVCKRINNSKRDFLFVNKFQGKHFPQNPSKILELLDEFIKNITIEDERVLVIGFAETATAIGNYVASKLKNCVIEMQTTRENIKNETPIIEFREEHSHATQQLLYGDREIFNNVDRVLFVEDEITTGNTIINFIDEIKKINPNLKYAVASILNWQDEQSSNMYKELNIETYYLIKGKIKDVKAKVDIETTNSPHILTDSAQNILCQTIKSELCNLSETRIGRVPIKDIDFYSNYLYKAILKKSKILANLLNQNEKNILIIGTEEFMYEPLLVAYYLEKHTNNNVYYHATTRSPIEASNEENYILNERYQFNSCYENERTTYLYNVRKYDAVFIITDSNENTQFDKKMANMFYNLGYSEEQTEIIRFGGYDEQFS